MFSSQLSTSTSKSSISSTDGESFVDNYRLPEKYRENCVYARKVFIKNQENHLDLLITDNLELVECQHGEIINYLNLSDFISNGLKKFSIESFDVLFCDDDRVIYAVKFNATLLGIERRGSQLKVTANEKNVSTVKKYFCNEKQEIGFLITFNDRRQQKFTKFLDDEYENFSNSETFHEIYKNVKLKRESIESHVETLSKEIQVLHLKQIPEVPKNLLTDVSSLNT